jgi:hypothetical protein
MNHSNNLYTIRNGPNFSFGNQFMSLKDRKLIIAYCVATNNIIYRFYLFDYENQ